MIAVITSQTKRQYLRRPTPPYVFNKDCSQAQGLRAFWPLGEPLATLYYDYVRTAGSFKLTEIGTMDRSHGPDGEGIAASNTGGLNALSSSSVPAATVPYSKACWVYPTNEAAMTFMLTGDATTSDYYALAANLAVAGTIIATSKGGQTARTATTTTTYERNTWNHACGVWTSSSNRRVFLNAGGAVTNT